MSHTPTRLVFLCGFPSSGTDLLKNLCNAHPDIHIGGEFPLLPSLAARYPATVPADQVRQAVDDIVGSDVYGNLARAALPQPVASPLSMAEIYASLLCTKTVAWAGNKTPQNSENIDRLERLFPGARYILIVRDVRDVALSWRSKWGKDSLLCAHRWNARMLRARQLLAAAAPQRHLIVTYEDLLVDHANVARGICDFLALPFDQRMIEFHDTVDTIVAGKLNYGKPVIRDNMQKWRRDLDIATVKRIEQIAFEGMRLFGYEAVHALHPRALSPTRRALGKMRDLYGMATVGDNALQRGRASYLWRAVMHEASKRFGRYRVTRP